LSELAREQELYHHDQQIKDQEELANLDDNLAE
jgi:hypothetical protein